MLSMLEWEQRIGLCRLLLTEMIDLSSPNEEDLGRHLEALDAYLTSGEFHAKDKGMKENETICMLGEVIMDCCHVYENICRMAENTMKTRRRKMNDWIRESGIEIVKRKPARKKSGGMAGKPGRPRKSAGLRESGKLSKEE